MVKQWNNSYKTCMHGQSSADIGFDHILNNFGHANN